MSSMLYKLHKQFPKSIPVMTCFGCLKDNCKHRTTDGKNLFCYYDIQNIEERKSIRKRYTNQTNSEIIYEKFDLGSDKE